ncbi:beta-CASP ribonuclease aCPSF1 [Candidatus Woesearchaeota archaeon]|nr:beta-CASP ribonuclease aCPSF1 [Candidatus Woesearchaeota archaeon]
MPDIIKEMSKMLPPDTVSAAGYEGANIVFYTKDKEFFLDNKGKIKDIVYEFKKRIELRSDPSILLDQTKAEKIIRGLIPEEAGCGNVIFDPERSEVIIESEKPGVAIGKQGETLKEIREKTLWVPLIQRTPAIRSEIIENIRSVLYANSDYRRKFLDRVGHRIYDGWIRGKKNEWVRVTCFGGARQVGRNCFLLQTPESRVLLDCGINVANEDEQYPMLECPDFNINELDAVILASPHIDHCGFIPFLYKFGYRGPVYCTSPTRDIAALLLLDFVKIQSGERKEPPFTVDDIKEMVKHTITLNYEEVTDITPDVRLTLYNAGCVLGSSMVHLHIGNGLHNLLYTGDMKYSKTMLLEPAATRFPRLETLMIESTYGGKMNVMPSQMEQDDHLRKVIQDTIKRGGKVIMPVLGSGRAQEVQVMIEKMMRNGELENIPVYIDGLVLDVTAIHTAYPEFLSSEVRKQIFHRDENPFLHPCFVHVEDHKQRKVIIADPKPCVILATSGMLIGGPVIEYLKYLAHDEKNTLVFSCYQAEGSLGNRIQRGEQEVIFLDNGKNMVVKINMEVQKIEITDHSDRKQLMNFVARCNPRPKKIIVIQGENSRALDLASSLHKQFRVETVAPRNLEAVRIR